VKRAASAANPATWLPPGLAGVCTWGWVACIWSAHLLWLLDPPGPVAFVAAASVAGCGRRQVSSQRWSRGAVMAGAVGRRARAERICAGAEWNCAKPPPTRGREWVTQPAERPAERMNILDLIVELYRCVHRRVISLLENGKSLAANNFLEGHWTPKDI
jgi:hypothetical protein